MDKGPIDTATPLGKRITERLRTEKAIWLTTVDPDGTPQPNPVWFLWEGSTVLVYSHNKAARLRNLRANPRVSLNFDTQDQADGDVHVISGKARIADDEPVVTQNEPYLKKYAEAIVKIGFDNEKFAKLYSVALRITPEKVRGF
ncbi:MAG TPA: TIGR03667 family PPOX class F420-dependent oxidoreductase [Candidatus Dormibacteraeota bacterium]|jgi:PPOX class probable F420-dependent enzyme